MMKKTLIASLATLALLASVPAFAQSAPPPDTGASPPAATAPSPGAGTGIITSQTSNEILAKDLMGSPVMTPDGKKIGVVKDLIIGPQGQVSGLVIASGSFLGLGGKSVGVSASKVSIESGPKSGKGDDTMVLVRLTQNDIQAAPEFKSVDDLGKSPPMQK
jgi:sporulation protein YlmC with PRC-barrel domain